jgi:biotin carboxyl carrier protein
MRRYRIVVGGRPFDVEVLSDPEQAQVEVRVGDETLTVQVTAPEQNVDSVPSNESEATGEVRPAAELTEHETLSASGEMLRAPLPGVVKSVTVRQGQHVAVGDELVVIEAMKMDNAIRATRVGTIAEVLVSEGHRVTQGEALLYYSD